jgi:hypothetical protein
MSSERVSDGSYSSASCSSFGCNGSAYNASHNVHYVRTANGIFSIEAPVSVGGTILLGMVSNGVSPTLHKQWFMDNLHEGDKILFGAQCGKHNRCTIRLPNPDKPTKEVITQGFFFPAVAPTNTTVLCGKGKLTADVEAQMCNQGGAPPSVPYVPGSTPLSVPARQPEPATSDQQLSLYGKMNLAAKQNDSAPTTNSQDVYRKKIVDGINAAFLAEKVVGYAEISGDTLIIHSERTSAMRFHMNMANVKRTAALRQAGFTLESYTNDADQNFFLDLVSGLEVGAEQNNESGMQDSPPAASPESAIEAANKPTSPIGHCNKYFLDKNGNQTCSKWSN